MQQLCNYYKQTCHFPYLGSNDRISSGNKHKLVTCLINSFLHTQYNNKNYMLESMLFSEI